MANIVNVSYVKTLPHLDFAQLRFSVGTFSQQSMARASRHDCRQQHPQRSI